MMSIFDGLLYSKLLNLEKVSDGLCAALLLNLAGFIAVVTCFVANLSADVEPRADYRTAFSDLPAIELPCVPQSRTINAWDTANAEAVSVRFARDQDGKAWLVISNDYPWTESFELQWNGLVPEIVRPLEDSPSIAIEIQSGLGTNLTKLMSSRWRCDIAAHSHGGWELKASEASIAQWTHRAGSVASAMLESELAKLSQSLTRLTQFHPLVDTPDRGGFETPDDSADVPSGWLASLNPTVSWQVSSDIARNGKRSLRYRTQQANAAGWIQSPAFALPDGGKVAAEAWIQLDPAMPRPKIVATTTLLRPDGSRQDWKQTYSQNYGYNKNVDWHRIDFPTLNSGSLGTKVDEHCRVRLALDIEGTGQLFIDDMCASRIFLDEEERRKLRSQLFVAQRELTQNRLEAAWQLTQSRVSRYVLENADEDIDETTVESASIAAFEKQPTLEGGGVIRKAERQPFRRKLR